MSDKFMLVHIAAKMHFVPRFEREAKEYGIDNLWRADMLFVDESLRDKRKIVGFRVAEGVSTISEPYVDVRITFAIVDDLEEVKKAGSRQDILLMDSPFVIAVGREWEYVDHLGINLNEPF